MDNRNHQKSNSKRKTMTKAHQLFLNVFYPNPYISAIRPGRKQNNTNVCELNKFHLLRSHSVFVTIECRDISNNAPIICQLLLDFIWALKWRNPLTRYPNHVWKVLNHNPITYIVCLDNCVLFILIVLVIRLWYGRIIPQDLVEGRSGPYNKLEKQKDSFIQGS